MPESEDQQVQAQLHESFPAPRRFGWIRLWRRDSGHSLGLAVALTLIVLVLVLWATRPVGPAGSGPVQVNVEAVSLAPAQEKELQLERSPQHSTDSTEDSVTVDSAPGVSDLPDLPDLPGPGNGQVLGGGSSTPDDTPVRAEARKAATGTKATSKKLEGVVAAADPEPGDPAGGGGARGGSRSRSGLFADRSNPARRAELVRQGGGSQATEDAVARGLKWLANHQAVDGSWNLSNFHQVHGCNCGDTGPNSPVAGTGLALLPFLAAGKTQKARGDYRRVVENGLGWLQRDMNKDGSFRGIGSGNMYAHALGTIALCEAYAMTRDKRLKPYATAAIHYIVRAQHPKGGGWRYSPGSAGDTSVLGWQMIALQSALAGGIEVPKLTLQGAYYYLDRAQTDKIGGHYSYMPGGGQTVVMTAEGLLCRQFLGWKADHPGLTAGIQTVLARLPARGGANFYYWYYATQVLHHVGGDRWRQWNDRMVPTLLEMQARNGHADGSWSGGGRGGGRVYTTALALLMLEVYYRHRPLYEKH